MPNLAIIIPFLDEVDRLNKTLNSIPDIDIEVILVCGSATHTTHITKRNHHITFIAGPPLGIYNAMNQGAIAARSDFLFFCGAGDVFIQRGLIQLLNQLNSGILRCDRAIVMPVHIASTNRYSFPRLNCTPLIAHHQGFLFPKKVFTNGAKFSTSFMLHGDWDLMAKIAQNAKPQLFHLPICSFAIGGRSTSGRYFLVTIRELIRVIVTSKSRYKPSLQHLLSLVRPIYYRIRSPTSRPST